VGSNSRVLVRFGDDQTSLDGKVVGSDPSSDIAVVDIGRSSVPKGVKPLQFADSRAVQVGDTAIAIGNPFGLDRTATEGIVSATGRSIKAPNGFAIDDAIQTDAPINPGNSGGPLLDGAGRVIGVNSQIATTGGGTGNVGIGYAVPSNTVRQVVPRLRAGTAIRRAYLGISSQPSSADSGALVIRVVAGGPAEQSGMLPGDVVSRVDGKVVRVPEDISRAIADHKPGDEIDIEVRRAGAQRTLAVTLGAQPANAPSSLSGP
jgi:putative serine protease PepD